MKQIGNILVSVPSTVVTVPEPVDYRDKRIDVMAWMAAHGNSTAYDWLKLHEPEIAAPFDEPDYPADIGALDGDFEPVPRLDEYEEYRESRLGSGDAHLTCNRCQRAVDYDDAKRDPRNDEPWCGCSLSYRERSTY